MSNRNGKNVWNLPALLAFSLLCALVAAPAAAQAADADIDVSGRIQLDFEAFSGGFNPGSPEDTGISLFERSLRLGARGDLDDNWNFKFEIDFSGSKVNLKDAYVQYNGLGELTGIDNLSLILGNTKAPMGLQALISGKNTPVLERSPASNAFAPGRLYGLKLAGYGNNFTYAAGIYKGSTDSDNSINATLAARGSYTPINTGDRLLHLGLSYGHFESVGLPNAKRGQLYNTSTIGSDRFTAYVSNSSPVTTSPALTPTPSANILGVEFAMVADSAYVQGEYFYGEYDLSGYHGHDRDEAHGLYVQAGLFLTGEMRPYNHQTGIFGAVEPNSGTGALEAYIQYSYLDFGKDLTLDYELDSVTAGLNWYANQRTRLGAAFVLTVGDNSQTDYVSRAFKARMQVVF